MQLTSDGKRPDLSVIAISAEKYISVQFSRFIVFSEQ